jgi:FKBP-type peptidyl-prolyl cis-trans isomerase FklB
MKVIAVLEAARRSIEGRRARTGIRAGIALLGLGLCAVTVAGNAPATPDTPPAKAGYSAGYEFGERLAGLKAQGSAVELEAVIRGILDALSGAEPLLDDQQRRAALEQPPPRDAPQPAGDVGTDIARLPARTRGFNDDFARLNAAREGVVVLPSGVQYEVLTAGSGKQPHAGDTVVVHYVGTLTNGVVFDSTRKDGEPARLALDTIVVPGLREALLLMSEGAKWRVVVPPAMGFGRAGNNMLRRRDLIYEIELLAVESPEDSVPSAAADPAVPAGGTTTP